MGDPAAEPVPVPLEELPPADLQPHDVPVDLSAPPVVVPVARPPRARGCKVGRWIDGTCEPSTGCIRVDRRMIVQLADPEGTPCPAIRRESACPASCVATTNDRQMSYNGHFLQLVENNAATLNVITALLLPAMRAGAAVS